MCVLILVTLVCLFAKNILRTWMCDSGVTFDQMVGANGFPGIHFWGNLLPNVLWGIKIKDLLDTVFQFKKIFVMKRCKIHVFLKLILCNNMPCYKRPLCHFLLLGGCEILRRSGGLDLGNLYLYLGHHSHPPTHHFSEKEEDVVTDESQMVSADLGYLYS